jgi:glutamate-ammonia-ligase adenylyltransferase
LRRARSAHALLIALADLGGVWSVEEVTAALSEFADASVQGGIGVLLAEAAASGKVALADAADPGPGCGFVVLALGKHGAGELNYSSDIDLVVFFDPASPALASEVEAPTFYSRLAQGLGRCSGSARRTATSTASITACAPTRARLRPPSRSLPRTPTTRLWARTGNARR